MVGVDRFAGADVFVPSILEEGHRLLVLGERGGNRMEHLHPLDPPAQVLGDDLGKDP